MITHHARRRLTRIITCLLSAVLLLGCSPAEPPQLQQATLLPTAKTLSDFRLVDQQGAPFTRDDLKGHWTFAFFGYTHCPDVCPTSLAMLARVLRNLDNNSQLSTRPRGLFVSVDPQRDTPAVLAAYLPYFHPDFQGATGDPEQITALTRQLGILAARAPGDSGDGDYLVDHSAAIILFDPHGRYYALFNVPHDPDKMVSDFLRIQQYYQARQ